MFRNFRCAEQQPLSVTSTSAGVQFKIAEAINQPDIMIVNYGTKGCQVQLANAYVVALNTANAASTTQTYISPGSVIILHKGSATWVSAICDGTDTTNLALHIGTGY